METVSRYALQKDQDCFKRPWLTQLQLESISRWVYIGKLCWQARGCLV